MKFMNEWDIQMAVERWQNHPVLSKATKLLDDLKAIVNRNSDGWAYWTAPVRAAKKLMQLIEDVGDPANEYQLNKAMIPIKSFYTKHKKHFGSDVLEFPSTERAL